MTLFATNQNSKRSALVNKPLPIRGQFLIPNKLLTYFHLIFQLHVAHYRRGICRLPFDLRFFDDTTLISGSFSNTDGLVRTPKELGGSLITEVKETINEKVNEEADGKIGLEYEIDVETETFEMFQMPQLSRGKYLHDFKVCYLCLFVRLGTFTKKFEKS